MGLLQNPRNSFVDNSNNDELFFSLEEHLFSLPSSSQPFTSSNAQIGNLGDWHLIENVSDSGQIPLFYFVIVSFKSEDSIDSRSPIFCKYKKHYRFEAPQNHLGFKSVVKKAKWALKFLNLWTFEECHFASELLEARLLHDFTRSLFGGSLNYVNRV